MSLAVRGNQSQAATGAFFAPPYASGTNMAIRTRLRAYAGLWTILWTRLPSAVWPQISRK
jgi:hypothetical protein